MADETVPTRTEILHKLCQATAERMQARLEVDAICQIYDVDNGMVNYRIQSQIDTFIAAICIHQGWDLNDDQSHAAAAELVDVWKAEHYPEERPGTTYQEVPDHHRQTGASAPASPSPRDGTPGTAYSG